MAISKETLNDLLSKEFSGADIEITDLAGDGDHYMVKITSELFTGKTKIAQHRMVNEALKGCLGGSLHALSIKTYIK